MCMHVLRKQLVALTVFSMSGICLANTQSALAASSDAAPAEVRRNAQEDIPPGLIGAWQLDLASSTLGKNAPKNDIRIFDYTHDGLLLCTHLTLDSHGVPTSGHWALNPDGGEGLEYTRPYGSTPFMVLILKKVGDTTFQITDMHNGKVFMTSTYKLEPDGNTLTLSRGTGDRKSVAVYRRWDTGK